MKKLNRIVSFLILAIVVSSIGQTQALADSIVQIAAEVQGLEQVAPGAWAPGTYWEAMPGTATFAPLPGPPFDATLPVYSVADGIYLVDATGGQLPRGDTVSAMAVESNAVVNLINRIQGTQIAHAMRAMGMDSLDVPFPGGGDGGDGSGLTSSCDFYSFDTNLLWLEITNVSNGLAGANLHNGTNQVYSVWSTTNLALPFTNWQVETEVWPTDTNSMPFTVATLGRQDLFLRAEDWTGVYLNGLPCWWTWQYFDNLSESASDYDPEGRTLGSDYNNGRDPNVIQFSILFTNYYVNTPTVPGQLQISGGVPFYMAVLENDTNLDDAVWQPYVSTNFSVTLGATNAANVVYVGLKGLPTNATPSWSFTEITLYTGNPELTLTSPSSTSVSQSTIQLQGYASHPLTSLTLDISNAVGAFAGQPCLTTGQYYDTNLLAYTTNYFESSSLYLTSGANLLTLHATDWLGNTTNLSLTLDYLPSTNLPALTVLWPTPGTVVSGSNVTIQAQVSDPTATVMASVNGNNTVGVVEANGTAWVQNLILVPGTNWVTLTMNSASGGLSSTNFYLQGNDVGLVIDPLPDSELDQASVTVTGSISDTNYDVTVNGQGAYYTDNNGDWEADGVPVSPTGTAILYAQVYTNGSTLIANKTLDQPQPPMAVLAGYTGLFNESGFNYDYTWTVNWAYDTGGMATILGYGPDDEHPNVIHSFNDPSSLPPDGTNYLFPGLNLVWNSLSINAAGYDYNSQAQGLITPSGQVAAGSTAAYLVLVSGFTFSNPQPEQQLGTAKGDLPEAVPGVFQVNGQPVVSVGLTNDDGTVAGVAVVKGAAGQPVPFRVTSTAGAASFDPPQAMNFQLTVVSNTAVQIYETFQIIGSTNWATIKSNSTNDYVIVQAMINTTNDVVLTNLAAAIRWTGGMATTNPLQCLVPKNISTNTVVTAWLSNSPIASIEVWVIWADLSVKTSSSETLNPDDQATLLVNSNWPTPVSYNESLYPGGNGLGGGNTLGPIDCLSNRNLDYCFAVGKIEAKAVLEPLGVGKIVTSGWYMNRTVITTSFTNGVPGPRTVIPPVERDDTSPRSAQYFDLTNGVLFDLDAPGCPDIYGTNISHTADSYANLYEYVSLILGSQDLTCSDTNTYSYMAQIDVDATNVVQANSISATPIALPNTSHYNQR